MKISGVSSAQRYDWANANAIEVVWLPPMSIGPRGSPSRFAAVSTAMNVQNARMSISSARLSVPLSLAISADVTGSRAGLLISLTGILSAGCAHRRPRGAVRCSSREAYPLANGRRKSRPHELHLRSDESHRQRTSAPHLRSSALPLRFSASRLLTSSAPRLLGWSPGALDWSAPPLACRATDRRSAPDTPERHARYVVAVLPARDEIRSGE
jgi:hypothetical protein